MQPMRNGHGTNGVCEWLEVDYTQTGYDEDLVDEKVGYLATFADDQCGRLVVNVAYFLARGFCIAHSELITHPSYQPSRRAREIAEALLGNLCPSDDIPTIPQKHAWYVKELRDLFPRTEANPNGHCWCRLRLWRWRSTEGPIVYV